MRCRATAWRAAALAVALAALAPAVGGCADPEPRALRLTVQVDSTVPAFDYVHVSLGSWRGGGQLGEETFRLLPTDLDADGAYSTILFITKLAESVDVLAEVHSGTFIVGHGRRSVVTLDEASFDLEVEVSPHPAYSAE